MASSSGCAINRHIRLLYNVGNDRANGEDEVDDNVQKMKIAGRVRARVIRVDESMSNDRHRIHRC